MLRSICLMAVKVSALLILVGVASACWDRGRDARYDVRRDDRLEHREEHR
jgi:hypothetical protein